MWQYAFHSPTGRTRLEPALPWAALLALALAAAGCTETFDAGSNRPRGNLPVDQRNPIVLMNDNVYENWQGEYAMLLASGGGPRLVGIIIGTGGNWTDINANVSGWRDLVKAAREAHMGSIPDPKESISKKLTRPDSGKIEETSYERSAGALEILDLARAYSLPYRPLVLVTGTRLTDVANAYLIDHAITEQVFVVSSLGKLTADGATMDDPNGEMDPWADSIVTSRFRYVQVSAYYDSKTDVPAERLSGLPDNPFGRWIGSKQPKIWELTLAADQVAVAAVGIPGFATKVVPVFAAGPVEAGATAGPKLTENPKGNLWLVREVAPAEATKQLWKLLTDPQTFAH
jgi:hypothetical protein